MLDMMKLASLGLGLASMTGAFPMQKRATPVPADVPIVQVGSPIGSPQNVLQVYNNGAIFVDQILQFTASNSSKLHQNKVDNGADLPGSTQFDFVPINSTLMQYSNDGCYASPPTGLCYGHVRVHQDNSNLVLTVNNPGKADGEAPYLDKEFLSDDSGQLLQFWSYDTSSQVLSFIGAMQNETSDPAWGYQGPYQAQGYSGSSGLAVLANVKDSQGMWYFKNLKQM